jgi:hypothetical protein
MTNNRCNGWRNAATWTVNLWFGDNFAANAEDGEDVTAEFCRETVECYVEEFIGSNAIGSGFIWDMLNLNSVNWDELAQHHAPETPHGEDLCRNGRPMAECDCC